MADEIEGRLARLAPAVDEDAALRALRTRRHAAERRRRAVLTIPLVLLVTLLVGVLALAGSESGSDPLTAADEDGDSDALPQPGHLIDGIARAGDVEVRLTAPRTVHVGTRVDLSVTVTNEGAERVYWYSDSCHSPFEVVLAPRGTRPSPAPPQFAWDGDPAALPETAVVFNTLEERRLGGPKHYSGIREGGGICLAVKPALSGVVEPGETLSQDLTVEARVPPGPMPNDGAYELTARIRVAGVVEVSVPVTLADHQHRVGTHEPALDAFVADPRLQLWLDSQGVDRPDLVQSYAIELSWWRDAWELWITPRWEGHKRLRMRYDPVSAEVVDVRAVPRYSAPSDEGGASVQQPLPADLSPEEARERQREEVFDLPDEPQALPELLPGQAEAAAEVVTTCLDHLRRGDLDAAEALLGDVARLEDRAGTGPFERLRSDHGWLFAGTATVGWVTPAWTWTEPMAVVTVVSPPAPGGVRQAAAFLTSGVHQDSPLIELTPGIAWTASPPPESPIAPGDRIRVDAFPVEGGARVHVDGDEIPVDVDHAATPPRMSFAVPDDLPPDGIIVTVTVATPELPSVHAFWYPAR
jgi:hypothetical protein